MSGLAPNRDASPLRDQRKRFLESLLRLDPAHNPAGLILRLDARSGREILAELPTLRRGLPSGGILALAETPQDGAGAASLRTTLVTQFRFVTTLQQRPLEGSVIAVERHAATRMLPLAEPVRGSPACLIHLVSDRELPAFAPVFLEEEGIALGASVLMPISRALPPVDYVPVGEVTTRANAVALVERLMRSDARLFEQHLELTRLRRQIDTPPATGQAGFFDVPRIRHDWPLAQDRKVERGLYDIRVDDDALCEGDAGVAFMARHHLDGTRPDLDGAVADLNAAPRAILSNTPDVSIIIPVYGQIAYTLNCLDSLFALRGRITAEIIVVDDASPDGSGSVLDAVRGISVVHMPANGGFIISCNTGASRARGRFVLLLNNDTRVVTGWLDALVDSFALFPRAGLVGSKMLYPDGSLQEAGGIIWRDGSCWNDGRNDDPNRPQYSYARQVDYVSGCSVMLPTELFHAMGGLDPHYAPAYCEDTDLALRLREQGHEVWFQPRSRVVHYEGRTSGTDTASGVKAYQRVNSRKLFARWHKTLAAHRPNGEAPFLERERQVLRRALIIDATTPTPRQDAGSVTTTLTLRLFQQLDYKAHFVPQDNFLFQPQHSTDLMQSGVDVAYAPYEVGIEAYLRRYGWSFDVVLVYRVTVLEQVIETLRRFVPQAPVLFHNMDLHFLRMEREAKMSGDLTALGAASDMKARELALIRKVDCTITHSTYEQALLAEAVPEAPVVVWPFMFEFHGTQTSFAERRDICFLGGYGHTPNVDAVIFFVREVLPLIHAHDPHVRFIIAGANPTPEVRALAGAHVIVTGQIEDLRDVFDRTRVFACSLRIGAGTKGKVSTAMSYGLPVVSTSCGAEGMDLIDGEDVLLADTATDFAAACLRAYTDPALWQHLSENGQALVQEKHSLAMGRRVLDGAIATALAHKLGLDQPASVG